jgi:DNA-binding NtrC family response regulator
MSSRGTILIVDDEKLIRMTLRERLQRYGYEVFDAEAGKPALEQLQQQGADLVLLDYRLPDLDGIQVLRQVRQIAPDASVIMMTAFSSVDTAVEALKLGAFDYLRKPIDNDELLATIERALETTRLRREVKHLRDEQNRVFGVGNIIGTSPAMREVFEMIRKIAHSAATTVLIQGESGTGKDLVAKAIHYASDRADKAFMNITCSAITETLLESELFGHERGAFTDARVQKQGLLEIAEGGTVFLDEIGDMGSGLQAKLLRFLEEKTFKRVGGTRDISVDVRVVAATHRPLDVAVREGDFREDLYYRLKVIPIHLPALKDRREDIPELVHFFVDQFNQEFKKETRRVTPEAINCLLRYDWPGNVRELKNVIERAMILETKDELDITDLPEEMVHAGDPAPESRSPAAGAPAPESAGDGVIGLPDEGISLREVERALVVQALDKTQGNQSQAARLLRISRDALRYKMKKFGLL